MTNAHEIHPDAIDDLSDDLDEDDGTIEIDPDFSLEADLDATVDWDEPDPEDVPTVGAMEPLAKADDLGKPRHRDEHLDTECREDEPQMNSQHPTDKAPRGGPRSGPRRNSDGVGRDLRAPDDRDRAVSMGDHRHAGGPEQHAGEPAATTITDDQQLRRTVRCCGEIGEQRRRRTSTQDALLEVDVGIALDPAAEVVCQPAAFLQVHGVGIEVMANSDNVLRGGLTPKHVDVPELLRVLEGGITVEVGEESIRLATGDAMAFPGDVDHTYVNEGGRPARFTLCVFEPGVGEGGRS